MEAVLLVIHLIIALGIIILVLIQPAESGGFLGQGGSMSNMMAPRRSGDVLTRTTGIFAALFFITSLSLALVASHSSPKRESILDAAEAPAAEAVVDTDEEAAAPEAETVADDAAIEAPVDGTVDQEAPKAPIGQ
jgi:preprotein translocase subunit SecG